jgi:4-amino-4-deoxy-L-arabinose transferase-like glycosyltransferase
MGNPDASTTSATTRDYLVVLLLTGLALALRLFGLGHESIWYDEAFSLRLAAEPVPTMCSVGGADPGNPAGYFLLLKAWLALFGATIESARALSALSGALAVPAVWLLARACRLTPTAGWLGALLVAVSPPLVYLGQEARVFALFATVATLCVACVAVIERGNSTWAWVGFSLLGALLVHLHYYGAFVLATLGLRLVLGRGLPDRGVLWRLALSALVVVLAFVPWLEVFRWQLRQGASRSSESWWQHLALMPLFDVAGRTLIWKEYGVKGVAAADLAVTALIFVPAAYLLVRCRTGSGLLLAWVIGLPLTVALVSLKTPMIHSHYLSVIIPAVLLLLACALDAGWRQGHVRLVAVPALVLGIVTLASLGRLYAVPHKDDWRGLAARTANDEAPVYFYEDIGADPFGYYRPRQAAHRLTEPFADGAGWDRKGDRARMRAESDGFWLVLYLSDGSARAEEEAVTNWLRQEFTVESDERFGRLRLLRCRPAQPARRASEGGQQGTST